MLSGGKPDLSSVTVPVLVYLTMVAMSVMAIEGLHLPLRMSVRGHLGFVIKIALLMVAISAFYLSRVMRRRAVADEQTIHGALSVCARALAAIDEGVLLSNVCAPGMPLIHVNPAFERITGYTAKEAIGKNCRYLQGADRLQPQVAQIRAAVENGKEVRVTLRNYRKDGSLFWNDLHLIPITGVDGKYQYSMGIIRDVTEYREMRSRLSQVENLDRLTSVANRYFFQDRLAALQETTKPHAVLVAKLDIARFHEINTSYGYETGDLLLKQVAERLLKFSNNAAVDSGYSEGADLVGRLAADEFVLAVPLPTPETAEKIMDRLRDVLRPQFVLPGATLEIRFAFGFTVAACNTEPTAIMRQAGMALQESKRSRLREVREFNSKLAVVLRQRMQLTTELQQALRHEDFTLHYQPKVDMTTGAVTGAEALLRWCHPVFGLQSPALFVPIAEETGLILDIGAWAFKAAASFAGQLNRERREPLPVSVNVSQLQFTHRDMSKFVSEVLLEMHVDPRTLVIELTESLVADSSDESLTVFRRLREMGIGLSIDDFGTGYSGLRYLEIFPISEVKIDRSFVQGLDRSRAKRLIIESVVRLAAELDIAVVAEGIETEMQRSSLLELGCRYGQGYLFGRPVSADTFLGLVKQQSV
ncbi:response regulator receiver modulated diguanylate cyclase/phosphodiesterase [Acidocella aminolytica 101 = DSM 11237]|uniref:Response regulator receiver modulated diguanylate cyclase/phosphodiesterase n=1 Tax=Acidocella aminolytica 101 = DSM 11237 TaxID=1120923 RepID=A0A0D6PK05_9PROT|nr:response regulator receiver modulated diguanylate cyclase/phosphodiesterase [Acidocella aminolytica 101 = DSM 11237]